MHDVIVIGGGQSGLAAARTLRTAGLASMIVEAGPEPTGSWPRYYDNLRLFSPASYSGMPGAPFHGDPDRYPTRDEVADYLKDYAASLDVDIRTHTRVTRVATTRRGFLISTEAGDEMYAAAVVAATGSFGNPHMPVLRGHDTFTGDLLHVANYRNPTPYAGRRVVVVGAGDSAVQVASELTEVAHVTLATRHPIAFLPQQLHGRDLHYWLDRTGFDHLPPEWLARIIPTTLVTDTGGYRHMLDTGQLDHRPMFTAFEDNRVVWADGAREEVDTVVFATGYRPHLEYLQPLGTLTNGHPQHTPGHLHHPPRPGLPRSGVPRLILLQHPARRAPRRRVPHSSAHRTHQRRRCPGPGLTRSARHRRGRLRPSR
jgi:putative flavoprotein involved in K+ transport